MADQQGGLECLRCVAAGRVSILQPKASIGGIQYIGLRHVIAASRRSLCNCCCCCCCYCRHPTAVLGWPAVQHGLHVVNVKKYLLIWSLPILLPQVPSPSTAAVPQMCCIGFAQSTLLLSRLLQGVFDLTDIRCRVGCSHHAGCEELQRYVL